MEPARKGRVPFFYVMCLLAAASAIVFSLSCAHTATNRSDAERTPSNQESSINQGAEIEPPADGTIFGRNGKKYARRNLDDLESMLERAQTENALLREENNWLRSEVNRLQQSLADANQTIYSLTRKLDAIFKPSSPVQ